MTISATLRTGAIATAATTASLLVLGKRYGVTMWAPMDAVSHIAWGERAYDYDGLDAKHTLVGAALNAGAMLSWAAIHVRLRPHRRHIVTALASGAAVSALAYVVDYHVVPQRLTPGFETKLPRAGLLAQYVVLALSLAAGALFARTRE